MNIRRFIRHICNYFHHRQIDWTLKNGDLVVTDALPYEVEIIDINWALMAAAVRLGKRPDAIVVYPLWSFKRYER